MHAKGVLTNQTNVRVWAFETPVPVVVDVVPVEELVREPVLDAA